MTSNSNRPHSPIKIGEIEKGVPIPKINHGRRPKYPYLYMEVGDSIVIPEADRRLNNWQRTTGFKFTSREIDPAPDGTKMVRVWRTE